MLEGQENVQQELQEEPSEEQTELQADTMQIARNGLFVSFNCVLFSPPLAITVLGCIYTISKKYRGLKAGPLLLVIGIAGILLCVLIATLVGMLVL